jgi:phosphonopyruvate decarboxylase
MISPQFFVNSLLEAGIDFFAGVPDSLLKNICAYLKDNVPEERNIIAANEGAAVGLAAGYHLATGQIPVVYMQNSGLGNTVNPLLSLTDEEVYNIPVLLLIGWRGEPGKHDEPQHVKQGKVTIPLLNAMGIRNMVMAAEESALATQLDEAVTYMNATQRSFAFLIQKGTFSDYQLQSSSPSPFTMSREEAIQTVAGSISDEAVIVSTTGMISRELFEYRAHNGMGHDSDFLTVGSMGHASQIALGIALQQPQRPVYCFDGDGATIMHMGSLGIIGSMAPKNYTHVVFNNGAHDSVGGQPTVGFRINIPMVASACGYRSVTSVDNIDALRAALQESADGPRLIEVKVKRGARKDLGRPTTTPIQNKEALMEKLKMKD